MAVVDAVTGRILDADSRVDSGADTAADMSRRLDLMDSSGVDRALLFPAGPLETDGGSAESGLTKLKAHNDWCADIAKISSRLRPVAVIDTDSITDAIAEAERVIDAGVRAVCVPAGIPPGGISPGHPDVDPLWQVFASSGVPIVLRAESRLNMFRSLTWDVEGDGAELFSLAQGHVMAKNYLTPMVYGGVFDRHPDLMVGCVQMGAGWIGPMAENLDGVAKNWFSKTLSKTLSLRPSQYIERNVRVTCAAWEPVHTYFERYGLDDVYIYGSSIVSPTDDVDPANQYTDLPQQLGPTLTEKFFATNASGLMP
ncbi:MULTISPECIES: amidohydrolase family protein [unclassified Mycolicibacterium]|uniref:amidohydrolase family protein n=1 Tax=unclassified Mycolicibacterium TaxID=2636767 RepID=UPI001F4BE688|nr:amidohydrolase family protein [Mycolicibacterium sp. YH-1]UNB52143.1 amidohydrolase family protein [Mycolicibacterium sp. YH-1]